ncbi:hypothetical protein J4460_02795 [Candidatus Woesearchaeota archaeon]|nr:MAG: hypothetical protein QS99_C0005G0057 [archaeon GW2011_AR4]MBS3129577.1 hypothetical protein [Candidatus Woesearchaeota archaeon]HIH37545.1 hypothetical protein [Candidatus Woesearchaeota archaeon]HIH49706.1 hypothetical protein [Candidatus Woesearchaeota archaeon]HIJ03200.1 hypothetical protein [Candidatus Woesearchaeota archaeon]
MSVNRTKIQERYRGGELIPVSSIYCWYPHKKDVFGHERAVSQGSLLADVSVGLWFEATLEEDPAPRIEGRQIVLPADIDQIEMFYIRGYLLRVDENAFVYGRAAVEKYSGRAPIRSTMAQIGYDWEYMADPEGETYAMQETVLRRSNIRYWHCGITAGDPVVTSIDEGGLDTLIKDLGKKHEFTLIMLGA